ncbi:hypothetical protein NQ314_018795 [Rhamnusium bicolor]|uniref:Nuclease HARBI1 n=1 Tax=Rhamnusium bicolor TaxID=1586634 RepID=A0AAV8WS71_9CUCU|nr:hypothetical protein NQ314_018795 [Rhamnusium bicolor]
MLPVQRFLINELEDRERYYVLRLQKRVMRDENDPFNLPDRRFIDLFRPNNDLVSYLFRKLVPHMSESLRVTKITREIRIFIALRFFATGNYQRGIGEEVLLSSSQQVVSRCIAEVSEAITENMSE